MKNKTVLMAAVLAVGIVLGIGLTVAPISVQDAQANPCAVENNGLAGVEAHCVFSGFVDIEEPEESE
jgi:hypothetical protein